MGISRCLNNCCSCIPKLINNPVHDHICFWGEVQRGSISLNWQTWTINYISKNMAYYGITTSAGVDGRWQHEAGDDSFFWHLFTWLKSGADGNMFRHQDGCWNWTTDRTPPVCPHGLTSVFAESCFALCSLLFSQWLWSQNAESAITYRSGRPRVVFRSWL